MRVSTHYIIYIRRREWRMGQIVPVVKKESFWTAKGVLLENDCFYIQKLQDLYGVGRNNCSGYGGDAIASYVIANLLRNTASRATTTHAICCAT